MANTKEEPYFYHPLENIEDIEIFEAAVERKHFTAPLSKERPYTYWTLELYDQKNGIRGGGGLGVLAADTRRVAEQLNIPFVLITPFYPSETHQSLQNGEVHDQHTPVNYRDFGFRLVDSVNIRCNNSLCRLDVVEKTLGTTKIVAITEPGFGELYSGMSGSDHRLYQEVALGFGGYQALKLLGLKPAIMQLNEVATFFAALARLDELSKNGMDFYEAVVYTRKHTLYTNHTLVQAAEAEFSYDQFARFVFPNLKSKAVLKWLSDKFDQGNLKLSTVTIEIAELRSGVSKLHARVASYHDLAGNKVKFKPITNGIDMKTWVLPETLAFYEQKGILNADLTPVPELETALSSLTKDDIYALKEKGREILNQELQTRPNQNGEILRFQPHDFLFDFKRRFVDYKRPELPFKNPKKLREILEPSGAHYLIAGRLHTGDTHMTKKLHEILEGISRDSYLKTHVHYLADYDEKLAFALSVGSNATINVPIVGLEACGTSWEKDVANLCLLISTPDGGVADEKSDNYLSVKGTTEAEELDSLYQRMDEAISAWQNDFDLEYLMRRQLFAFLPIISGTRMLREYLEYLF